MFCFIFLTFGIVEYINIGDIKSKLDCLNHNFGNLQIQFNMYVQGKFYPQGREKDMTKKTEIYIGW